MTDTAKSAPVPLTHADQILLEMAALVFIFGMAAVFFRIAAVPEPAAPRPPAAAVAVPAAPVTEPTPPEPAGHPCEAQAADIAALTACLESALAGEQAALQAVYGELTRLAPGAAPGLERSQATWRNFVRADCELQAQPFAGTAAERVMGLNCEHAKTAARARALAALAEELRQIGGGAQR